MKKKRGAKKEAYLFILPAVIYLACMIGYPLVYNLVLSFRDVDVMNIATGTSKWIGFKNYYDLFHDETFLLVLRNTLIFTACSLIFQFVIGFLMALFFAQKFTLSGPLRGLMLIPWMMPVAVSGMLGKNIFDLTGVFNDILMKLGIIQTHVGWLSSPKTALMCVIISNIWIGVPFDMLLLTSGLCNISNDVYESAAMDGAGVFQRFWYITMPLMKSSILSVVMLGFIYTFKAFDLIYTETAGGPIHSTDVMGTYIYQLSFNNYEFSLGSTVAVILLACLMCVGVFYLYLIIHEDD